MKINILQRISESIIILNHKFTKQKFSKENLVAINILSKSSLTFIEILTIIKDEKNKHIIMSLKKELNAGDSFTDIFPKYLNKVYYESFMNFSKFLDFNQSLHLTLEIEEINEQLRNSLISKLLYPIILFVMTSILIFFFSTFAFTNIMSVFKEFDYDFKTLEFINILILVFIKVFYLLIVVILTIFTILKLKSKSYLLYIFIANYNFMKVYKSFVSTRFIRYFNECSKIGLKTKESLALIKSMNNPIISLIATNLHLKFLSGESIKEVIECKLLDSNLSNFFNIAMYSNNLNEILEQYIDFTDLKFKQLSKKVSNIILVFSYIFICLIIIFIYSVLFVPLSIMGTL